MNEDQVNSVVKMTIASMVANSGGVVSTQLHEDKISIEGVEVPVYIAELPDGVLRSAFDSKTGYDRLQLILEGVRDADGTYAFKDDRGQLRMIPMSDGSKAAALHKIKFSVAKQLEALVMKYNDLTGDSSEAEAEGNG